MRKATAAKANASKAAAKKPAAKKKANGYQMPEKITAGEILTDLSKQQWRIGTTIGSGGFGDIYCANKADGSKKTDDYPFVVKVEPHGNGPLFVEMHFYMRNGKLADIETFRKKYSMKALGMPHFVGHGSHDLNKIKHRFVVMPRYGQDIWQLFIDNNRRMPVHTIYRLAIQMLDVYQYIHECTYVHADLKGANMLLGYGKGGGSQAYLVDFGLASHYTTKDFKPDPKKMHNGTIEYTSRDAHHGVPTMRGDFEILAYNVIQWCGVQLPWESEKLLTVPNKVQAAKEDFMKNVDASVKKCFGSSVCPESILAFTKYVAKMNYDTTPDYEKCRKDFNSGLKALGKTNAGDLEFSSAGPSKTISPSAKENVKPRARSIKSPIRPDLTKITERSDEEPTTSNKRPATTGRARKRVQTVEPDLSDEEEPIVSPKKVRGRAPKTIKATPTVTVNNDGGSKSGRTVNLNFELDISFDANVVVNVKRKPRKSNDRKNKPAAAGSSKPKLSIQSTDEIPATEQSFISSVRVMKKESKAVKKESKPTKTSPRSYK